MGDFIKQRNILLGISGSIAAYKSAILLRLLKKAGADVQTLMTPDASRFIPPLTLSTLSGKETLIDIFPEGDSDVWTKHINLGLWGHLYVIAPATAQTIAKLAYGFCDSMLTAVALAARCPIMVFPAMDHDMYVHPATQRNLDILRSYGYHVITPEHGELASGLIGMGRLPEPEHIVKHINDHFYTHDVNQHLAGKKVLISAGPTREALDPIRFISNHSTGTMGYELAAAAQEQGAQVILVSGPTHLNTPTGVSRINVTSAAEMADAVFQHKEADIIIMAAAVGDYTPAKIADQKIKKQPGPLTIELKRTTDILAELGKNKQDHQVLIGFALETENLIENATKKLQSKNADWIVLNSPNDEGGGFGTSTNKVTLIHRDGSQIPLPLMQKKEVARSIIDQIAKPVTS